MDGSVEFGETGRQPVIPEVREELGVEVFDLRHLSVSANLFTFDGRQGHEIVFGYDAQFADRHTTTRAKRSTASKTPTSSPPTASIPSPPRAAVPSIPRDSLTSSRVRLPDRILSVHLIACDMLPPLGRFRCGRDVDATQPTPRSKKGADLENSNEHNTFCSGRYWDRTSDLCRVKVSAGLVAPAQNRSSGRFHDPRRPQRRQVG